MEINFSKFKPADFLPKFGATCPKVEDLQTGDLLFPRMHDVLTEKLKELRLQKQNDGNHWLVKTNHERWTNKDKPIWSFLDATVLAELRKKALTTDTDTDTDTAGTDIAERRSLDITAVLAEIVSKEINNKPPAPGVSNMLVEKNSKNSKNTNIYHNHNSLYASDHGMQVLNQLFEPEALQIEILNFDFDKIFEDPKLIELLIKILFAAGFLKLIKSWFNVYPSAKEFWQEPIIGLLVDLLRSSDARTNVFIGHVGIVIKENGNTYIIEDNITSYSHYRVSIHPYYVQNEYEKTKKYFDEKYANYIKHQDPTKDYTDYDLSEAQATGWLNRRAAKLEHVWHARPVGLTNEQKKNLVLTAKALHGRPFGFFDNPQFGHDDRMYCAEYVYNVFKNGVSQAAADSLSKKMTWGYIETYLIAENNKQMLKFVQDILKDTAKYNITRGDKFFVLPPAILWNSPSLDFPFQPYGKPYAPALP